MILALLGSLLPIMRQADAADTTPARPPVAQPVGNGPSAGTTKAANAGKPIDPDAPCNPAASLSLPGDDAHAAMAILPSTRWQPVGGDVQFELTRVDKPLDNVAVYFAWRNKKAGRTDVCYMSLRVRLLPAANDDGNQTFRYAARVPGELNKSTAFGIVGFLHWNFLSQAVPLAEMFVQGNPASDPSMLVHFTESVGITTPWIAMSGAILSLIIVGVLLAHWARARAIPGRHFIRIISTPNGVASLSQFQILIWTFVIGGGAIYVMMLSGNLIDIPMTTLALLGVTGLSFVGSKLVAGSDGTPQRVSAPGAVTNLTVLGTPTADTVVLSWAAPPSTDQPFSYTIQVRAAGAGAWYTVAHNIAAPPSAVIGLSQNTQYEFQVFAINLGGPGPAAVPVTAATAAQGSVATAATPQVTDLRAMGTTVGSVLLTWSRAGAAQTTYTLQYRAAGTLLWTTYKVDTSGQETVIGLDSGTTYEFQVFAVLAGVPGAPSNLVTATTHTRTPQWSDLVMSGDTNPEIDLARLQMLVFTTISAAFTGLALVSTGVIPELPVGELALVGISNGVYLASKVRVGSGQ